MIWYMPRILVGRGFLGLVIVGFRGSELWSPVYHQVVVERGGGKVFMVIEWSF